MPTLLTWTDKQREIFKFLEEGKEFKEITDLGYTRNMVSRVKTAREDGQKPEPLENTGLNGSRTNQNLITVTGPKGSPITFKVGTKEIVLDPLELNRQYEFYTDLAKKDGMKYSFSEVLTIGIQTVWFLVQDVPLTENVLTAIFYGYTGGAQ